MTFNRQDNEQYIYETSHVIGEENIQLSGFDLHHPVFLSSVILILVFVLGTLIFPDSARVAFEASKAWSINTFDWLFMIGINLILMVCLFIIVSPFGKIRLGGTETRPDFSTLSWFAMLFSAGMGIGLMFFSVAEPVAYYTQWYGSPFNIQKDDPGAAAAAMGATMFHWGFHAWSVYAIVGLSLAFFAFNCQLPLTLRSCLFPLFGEKVWKAPGNIIDTVAVVATIFGLATSLGLGAKQAAAGLHFLTGIENTIVLQIIIIFVVTAIATFSVFRGLSRGVRILSNINMSLALILLIFLIITTGTSVVINDLGTTISGYIEHIVPLSNWIGREDEKFYHGWTIFYWAWWISWSPFVGMFIARISKGRTVREFLLGVLIVPTLLTLLWMSVFGGRGISQVKNNIGELSAGMSDTSLALFQMLENVPLDQITSVLAIILVLVFFVTSSDSGSLVIDTITAGGKTDAPVVQRIFWAITQGIIASVLLYGGGENALGALQSAAITVGLPFTVVLLLITLSLVIGLNKERKNVFMNTNLKSEVKV
ncbi:MAG: BCCT family transporter [Gammaproteobacteria bacterium]|nr:BCCT family transporter [Gammaproteobacteria bacterium]